MLTTNSIAPRWVSREPLFQAILALWLLAAWAMPSRASEVKEGPMGANITTVQFKSESLREKRPFNLLLPADYATSTRRYPTLYLLHGLGDDHMAWSLMTNLSGYATQWNLIIVMPNADRSFYVNSAADRKARYEDLIVKDLVPYIDSHYRTIPLPRSRAVAGLSMGGYGAMFLGLKHYGKFSAVGSFSGALDYVRSPRSRNQPGMFGVDGPDGEAERAQRDPFVLLDKVPPGQMPALFIACGGQDFLLEGNRAFVDLLSKKKIAYEYHEISPRIHSWDFWNDELCQFVEYLKGLRGFEGL